MRVDRCRRGVGVLVDFSGAQQRRDGEVLDYGKQQSRRYACKRSCGNDARQHGGMRSMAGKARRVSSIVRTVVDCLGFRKPGTVDEQESQ
jgi:hypothetical protein